MNCAGARQFLRQAFLSLGQLIDACRDQQRGAEHGVLDTIIGDSNAARSRAY